MAKRHEHIFQLTQDWMAWMETRKYYGGRGVKCVLGKLQPFSGDPYFVADGSLSAEINAFNAAINHIERERLLPFVVVYCQVKPKPIHVIAEELGMSRYRFNNLAHAVALEIYELSQKLILTSIK